jgi:hypothetical protein
MNEYRTANLSILLLNMKVGAVFASDSMESPGGGLECALQFNSLMRHLMWEP